MRYTRNVCSPSSLSSRSSSKLAHASLRTFVDTLEVGGQSIEMKASLRVPTFEPPFLLRPRKALSTAHSWSEPSSA